MYWHFSLFQVSICRASLTWTTSQFSTRMSRRAVLARRSVQSDLVETVKVSPVVNLRFRGCSTRKRRRKEWRWRREKWERKMPLLLGNSKKSCSSVFLFCFVLLISCTGENQADLCTSSSIPIDYNLYRKFWTLQDYFRNPVQCYDKVSWITFVKVRCQNFTQLTYLLWKLENNRSHLFAASSIQKKPWRFSKATNSMTCRPPRESWRT